MSTLPSTVLQHIYQSMKLFPKQYGHCLALTSIQMASYMLLLLLSNYLFTCYRIIGLWNITLLVIVAILLGVIFMTLLYFNEYVFVSMTSQYLQYQVPNMLDYYSRIIQRPYSCDTPESQLEQFNMLHSGLSASMRAVFNVCTYLFMLMFIVFCLFSLNHRILIPACFVILLYLCLKRYLSRKLITLHNEQVVLDGRSNQTLSESFQQLPMIRTSNIVNAVIAAWYSHFISLKKHTVRINRANIINQAIDKLLPLSFMFISLATVFFGRSMYATGSIFSLLIYINQIGSIIDKLNFEVQSLIENKPCIALQANLNKATAEQHDVGLKLAQIRGDIAFKEVSLQLSEEVILSSASFMLPAGSFIGVTGSSGSGKSTLFKLMTGLVNPDAGTVSIDGYDLRQIDLAHYRRQIGVVLQTTPLLPGTILSNIKLHREMPIERAWELASLVGLADDIAEMPMQLFTHISDQSGESLSGGQKQRLLIARALASSPAILLLDEATSALDVHALAQIQLLLERLTMTRIVISHQASVLQHADCVYEVRNGGFVEM